MEKELVKLRNYVEQLQVCIKSLELLKHKPKLVQDVFVALLFQANLEYIHLHGIIEKNKKYEKKEKKNAR